MEGEEEEEEEQGVVLSDMPPPPSYCVAVEMAHLSDSSGDSDEVSDVTALTELGHKYEIESVNSEGTVISSRHSTPAASCESSCWTNMTLILTGINFWHTMSWFVYS